MNDSECLEKTTKKYIFNQYYIALIKNLRKISKKHKDKSTTAKKVFNSIKNNYLTLDKTSDQYLIFAKNNLTNEVYDSYKLIYNKEKKENKNTQEEITIKEEITDDNDTENDNDTSTDINTDNDVNNLANKWLETNLELLIYENITLNDIKKVLRDEYICHHYLSLFLILSRDKVTDEDSTLIVTLLQKNNYDDELNEIEDKDDNFKTILKTLQKIKHIKIKKSVDINIGGMENTTLGQLAKEILEDVDVNKLQKSIGENGDVLKSLGDPNSGFGDIISSVSQKMATKLSTGELNQENLI